MSDRQKALEALNYSPRMPTIDGECIDYMRYYVNLAKHYETIRKALTEPAVDDGQKIWMDGYNIGFDEAMRENKFYKEEDASEKGKVVDAKYLYNLYKDAMDWETSPYVCPPMKPWDAIIDNTVKRSWEVVAKTINRAGRGKI